MTQWQTYVEGLKKLNAGLERAGVIDGVWSPRAKAFRQTGGRLLTDIPYNERLAVVRNAWKAALTEQERVEAGPESFGEQPLTFKGVPIHFDPFFGKRYGKSHLLDMLRRNMSERPQWYYHGADWAAPEITGKKADMIIIDDPIRESQTRNPKVKAALKKLAKKTYNTVGVRFLRGHNLAKVYTYKVPKKTKLQLGEEVVVPSTFDGLTTNGIGVVVELHKEPQDTGPYNYVFVTGRIARIAQ
jgi:hypothetical protein